MKFRSNTKMMIGLKVESENILSLRTLHITQRTSNPISNFKLPTSYLIPSISRFNFWLLSPIFFFLLFSSCRVYSFKDVSIKPEVKTIKMELFGNRARYVNPQLAPRLTDRFQTKVVSQTRLTRTNNDDAHYQISGYVSDYSVTTSAISNQQAAANRLTVTMHIIFKNTLDNKTQEFDISRNFDFSANLSLQQAEGSLNEEIIRNLADEIFNRIFSNW